MIIDKNITSIDPEIKPTIHYIAVLNQNEFENLKMILNSISYADRLRYRQSWLDLIDKFINYK